MKEFSLFSTVAGIYNIKPTDKIELKDCADFIRSAKPLIELTNKLRSIQPGGEKIFGPKKNKTQQEALKENLPYVTFSGLFSSRANDKLITHSGYICIDLDHIGKNGQMKELQDAIKGKIIPSLMFVSPSGTGLKAVFAIDVNEGSHLQYYNALKSFFKEKFSLDIDKACKDVSRACFLCHDPEVFFSDSPTLLNKTFIPGDLTTGLKKLPASSKDESSIYEAAEKWTNSQITFMEGNRNQYITTLAGACNRMGISEQFASNQLGSFATEGFTQQEIDSTIKSIYRNTQYHNAAPLSDQNPDRKQPISKPIESPPPPDGESCPYIRVGVDYFKVINKKDRYGIERRELKRWTKDALITDFKRGYLKTIPKYDDFVQVPDNLNYQGVINNCYNMYAPFCHIPAQGEWSWTRILLEQVFGEQYEYGIRYMQILYCYPNRPAPILVLVSSKQKTGKTTFINWISMLFGSNTAVISSLDFQSMFNGHYATKNIVMIEETLLDRKLTIERLKAIATAKQLSINRKNIDQFNLDYFGKIILTSNYEDKFAQISPEETRFFVRKLEEPKFKRNTIEKDLLTEIPAFLHYLASRPPVSDDVDRSGFTSEELRNEFLDAVKEESKHETCKDLKMYITDYFNNNEGIPEFYATPLDIKTQFFPYDNRTGISWLLRVLKEDFEKKPEKLQRYTAFGKTAGPSSVGRPYLFLREDFVTEKIDDIPF